MGGARPGGRIAPVGAAVGLLLLSSCAQFPHFLDPWGIDGRDGGGAVLTYPALMRVGAAAEAGGDASAAVGIFRRAAQMNSEVAAPLVGAGNALLEMGEVNEAIVAYNGALKREPHDPEALRSLAKAYLKTARPALAGGPLEIAFQDTPNDPKLLQLIGVADDFLGQHREAQARYRRGLELKPGDPALALNLALSLALTESYDEAIGALRPVATAPTAGARERQTLALIYGLKGDRAQAAQMGRLDLDPVSVDHNLAYYETLRRLSPQARSRAIRSLGSGPSQTS
ncbi:MAG TPA: tetratricopeptide repeat protein [Stellaceae bacterium]|jgi:Flp pilus assembly protein TadD|nr:tetratricopeptide repeat protein [Stellaceae bacterium]